MKQLDLGNERIIPILEHLLPMYLYEIIVSFSLSLCLSLSLSLRMYI